MPRIMQPVVSPRGRVILLTGATLWLIAAIVLSATPDGVGASTGDIPGATITDVHTLDQLEGAPGVLYYPRVTTAGGRAYVADRGQHHVVRLASDLRTAEVIFGREGAGPGELQMPHDVAVDSKGNVFVADPQLNRLTKFAGDGTFVRSIAAPGAASLLVDSQDRLIAYPAPGTALLQRYDNDLGEIDTLLEKPDPARYRSSLGVLIAMGPQDQLYVLDQAGPTISVYDRAFTKVNEWQVDPPRLRESIDAHLETMRKRMPEGYEARWNGVQSMAIDPDGQYLVFFYLVKESPDIKHTHVAWYGVDGEYLTVDKRVGKILSGALLPNGLLVEGNAEEFRVVARSWQNTPTASGNN